MSRGGSGPEVELGRSLRDSHQGKVGGRETRKEAGSVVLVREDKVCAGVLELPSGIFTPALVGEENYPHFTSRKLRIREPMELAQDHTACV